MLRCSLWKRIQFWWDLNRWSRRERWRVRYPEGASSRPLHATEAYNLARILGGDITPA